MTKCQRSIDKMGDAGKKVGQAAVAAVCSLVYGGVKGGIKIAQGNGKEGAFDILDSVCPIGISSTVKAVDSFVNGDVPGGVKNTLKTVFPGGLLDPISSGLSEATGELGKGITEKLMGNNSNEETPEPKPKNAEKKEAEEKEEEKEDARDITNQQANTARKAAYQAAINAGATPAQAQSAADAQTPIGNYAGNYAALSGAGANARAAYRERQGYADALSRETENLENARTKAIIAAALSGGGTGAQTGISLFGN